MRTVWSGRKKEPDRGWSVMVFGVSGRRRGVGERKRRGGARGYEMRERDRNKVRKLMCRWYSRISC